MAYLGFRDEEPDEDEHGKTEASEGDERSIASLAHGRQHVRDSTGDDQVEEPLSSSSERNVQSTKTGSRNLRDINPAHWSPTPLEEGSEQVDADEGDVAGRRNGLVLLRWRDTDEKTDVHHRTTHGNRGPEQRFATTERVGGKNEKETAHGHLDHAVDPRGEKTDLGALQSEVFEDLRCVCARLVLAFFEALYSAR